VSKRFPGIIAPAKSWLSSQDFLAGVALLCIGGFALYQGANLTAGSLAQFGPGLLPRVLAIGVVLSGALILVIGIVRPGEQVSDFRLRGPIFISAALSVFALAIKPLGLIVAAPLTILIASLADPQTRWQEAALLAALITAASLLVFGYLLSLSIPSFPSREVMEIVLPAAR
jgi:putative tricarboxylic transport membrane protein